MTDIRAQLAPLLEVEEYEQAEALLASSAGVNDASLRSTHVLLLIHLERFLQALHLLSEMKIEDEQGYFNRAYCLYRLARYQEAKQIIEEAGRQENPLSRRLRTLLAQILYRLNQFDQAARLYDEIARLENDSGAEDDSAFAAATGDDDDDRIRVNRLAALSCQAALVGKGREFSSLPKDHANTSHETLFNGSCYLMALGRYEEALGWADMAIERIIQESTERDDGETGRSMGGGHGTVHDNLVRKEVRPYYMHRAALHVRVGKPQAAADDLVRAINDISSPDTAPSQDLIEEIARFHRRHLKDRPTNVSFFDNISAFLKSTAGSKLGPLQMPIAKLYLALGFHMRAREEDNVLARDKLYTSAARILRKLIRLPLTRALATALFFETLYRMNLHGEIRQRAKKCPLMAYCLALHRHGRRECPRLTTIQQRQQNYSLELIGLLPPGLVGALGSLDVSRKKHQVLWRHLPGQEMQSEALEIRVADKWGNLDELIALRGEANDMGISHPAKLDVAIDFLSTLYKS